MDILSWKESDRSFSPSLDILLWLGSIAIGSGILFFIAYNWQITGKIGHFAMLEGFMVVSILPAIVYGRDSVISKPSILLSILTIGALLSYLGQIYHSGEPEWKFLAIWALFALPFVIASRSWIFWILYSFLWQSTLFLLVGDSSPFLFTPIYSDISIYAPLSVSILSLIVWEYQAGRLEWLPPEKSSIFVWCISLLSTYRVTIDIFDYRHIPSLQSVTDFTIWTIWVASAYFHYSYRRVSLSSLSALVLSVVTVISTLFIEATITLFDKNYETITLLSSIIFLLAGEGGYIWIKRLHTNLVRNDENRKNLKSSKIGELPLYTSIIPGIQTYLSSLALILFISLFLGPLIWKYNIAMLAVGAGMILFGESLSSKSSEGLLRSIHSVSVLAGIPLLIISIFRISGNASISYLLASATLYGLSLYSHNLLVRTLSMASGTIFLTMLGEKMGIPDSGSIIFFIFSILYILIPSRAFRSSKYEMAIGFALSYLYFIPWHAMDMVGDFWNIGSFFRFAGSFTLLLTLCRKSRPDGNGSVLFVCVATSVILSALTISAYMMPGAILAFVSLSGGYGKRGEMIGALLIIMVLGEWYYDLSYTLLAKSIMLVTAGILMLSLYRFASKGERVDEPQTI